MERALEYRTREGIITYPDLAVIILLILFAILSQPIAREIVTAARANTTSYAINLAHGEILKLRPPVFLLSAPHRTLTLFRVLAVFTNFPPAENRPGPRSGQLTIGEK